MSGIVRRIDELGRIVIPKELRKCMRIQVGDEIEICLDNNELTLKKYNGFESVLSMAQAVASVLSARLGGDVVFFDAHSVSVAEGKNKKLYLGAKIDERFAKKLYDRQPILLDAEHMSEVFEGVAPRTNFAVQPVVCAGDFVGCIGLLTEDEIAQSHKQALQFCADIISNLLEQ